MNAIPELFLLALMLFAGGAVLLLGYALLIAITAANAWRKGEPVRPAIQPLLNEWSAP